MRDVGIFLGKLSWRLLTVVGVVPVAQSRPIKFLWHSPPLSFSRKWLPVLVLLVMLGLTVTVRLDAFEIARRFVLHSPFTYSAHLRLAEAAVLAADYPLAKNELAMAESLLALGGDTRVLGVTGDMDQVRKLVFPEAALRAQVTELETEILKRPDSRDMALRLALLYWRLGETDKANDYLNRAAKLDPNNTWVEWLRQKLSTPE